MDEREWAGPNRRRSSWKKEGWGEKLGWAEAHWKMWRAEVELGWRRRRSRSWEEEKSGGRGWWVAEAEDESVEEESLTV